MVWVVISGICFACVGASVYAYSRYFRVGPQYFLKNLQTIRQALGPKDGEATESHTDAETRKESRPD